eukprot:57146_1
MLQINRLQPRNVFQTIPLWRGGLGGVRYATNHPGIPHKKYNVSRRWMPKWRLSTPHYQQVQKKDRGRALLFFARERRMRAEKLAKNFNPAEVIVRAQVERIQGTFYAPLNPSPVFNPLFGKVEGHRSLQKLHLPISSREPLGGHPEAWVREQHSTEKIGLLKLSPDIFNQTLRKDILYRVYCWHRDKLRQGTHKEKGPWEKRGGGRKPWPQKGTGRARHGSIRSPLWHKGGTCHPRRPKDYSYPLPKRIQRLGLKGALSQKLREGNLEIVDTFPSDVDPAWVRKVMKAKDMKSIYFVDHGYSKAFQEALFEKGLEREKEFAHIHYIDEKHVTVYGLLYCKHVIISTEALKRLEERIGEEAKTRRHNEQADRNWEAHKLVKPAVFAKPGPSAPIAARTQRIGLTEKGRAQLEDRAAQVGALKERTEDHMKDRI